MGRLNKLSFIAVCCVVIATPIIRYKLKAQNYLETLSSGVILEATQGLRGSVFENTKVLLVDYLPEGSTGVVLNVSIEEGVERFKQLKLSSRGKARLNKLENIPYKKEGLFWGGPMAQSHLFWLAYQPKTGAISMVGNKPAITTNANSAVIARFVGYAGWSENQLEKEILKGDWRVFKAHQQQISQWLLANNSINKKSESELSVE